MQFTASQDYSQILPYKMPVKGNSCSCERTSFNTLAHSRKLSKNVSETLKKRANAKAMNYAVLGSLMDLKSELYEHYKRASFCCNQIKKKDGKLVSLYCNSRACLVCNRIRTGKLINEYTPLFKRLKDPYFLTLTKPTVEAAFLRDGIGETVKQFSRISDVLRKRGFKLDALRKIEVTYTKGKFHAHLHLIVDNELIGLMLLKEWLKRNPSASPRAQCLKKANKETLAELFKYVAKPPIKKDGTLNAWALDRILCAMYRKKTLQPYGLFRSKQVSEDVAPEDATLFVEDKGHDLYVWVQSACDWLSVRDKSPLSGHKPREKLIQFLKSNYHYDIYKHS